MSFCVCVCVQVDMKTQGDSLYDIVDKRDHGTVQAQLLHGGSHPDSDPGTDVSLFCRMNMSRTLKRQSGFGDVKVSLTCNPWLISVQCCDFLRVKLNRVLLI